jgi:hypothetical protein
MDTTIAIPNLYDEAHLCDALGCTMRDLTNWRKAATKGSPLYLAPIGRLGKSLVYDQVSIIGWLKRNPRKKEQFLSIFAPRELHELLQG